MSHSYANEDAQTTMTVRPSYHKVAPLKHTPLSQVTVEGSPYERLWSLRGGIGYELLVDRTGLRLSNADTGMTRISRSLLRNYGIKQTVGFAYYYVQARRNSFNAPVYAVPIIRIFRLSLKSKNIIF